MPKLTADVTHLGSVQSWILRHPEYAHLRAIKRGDTIALYSGPDDDPIPHVRLRRATVQWWYLDIANHVGKWEPTDIRASISNALDEVAAAIPWVLSPRE